MEESRENTLERMKQHAGQDAGRRERMRDEAEKTRHARPRHMRRRPGGRLLSRLIVLAVLVLLIVVLGAIFLPRVKESLRLDAQLPQSIAQLLPDEQMGYNKLQFQEAILGETREKSDLVVLEQDVQVTTEISQALANIALFEKTQTLLSFGTGAYTVDLSGVDETDIAFDGDARLVTLTIPHARLAYVDFDVTKTESGETKRALFGFGDIKLTTEQLTILESTMDTAMREKLNAPESLAVADERALVCVRELIEPIVRSVAAEFSVKVVMQEQ